MTPTEPPSSGAAPEPDGPPLPEPAVHGGPPFPIVGVGASAGGLEAFSRLLEQMPADPGLAMILVVHLDPHQESLLSSILGRTGKMPVREAADNMKIEANHLYVIPPGTTMTLSDGHLRVRPRSPARGPHMPIDHLFRSLAPIKSIGVVLSGGGSDGSLGLQEISAEGGITFAQDEHSARYDSMPRSAVATGCVDFVLPPEGIARELLRIVRHPQGDLDEAIGDRSLEDEDIIHQLFATLRGATGIDFSQYKRTTVNRRVRRRMTLHGLERLDDYLRFLQDNQAEIQALYQDLLIRVTSFFRDPLAFQTLQNVVFPRLIHGRSPDQPLRIWVAGCATGEEVYSIAITLLETLGDRNTHPPIKILATDVSQYALDKARAGVFLENIEVDVSPERLHRYFVKINGHYQISKSIRDMCVFARHNLMRDPPFSKLDLISCRNVLIYLNLALQKRVMPIFHYALQPGGFLMLGSSETIGSFSDLFELVNEKQKIYVKKPAGATPPFEFDMDSFHGPEPVPATSSAEKSAWTILDVQREADRLVLNRYGPPGVVIDENLNILQFRGHTGPFLEPSPGTASFNVLKMAREGLLVELRKAITQAKTDKTVVRKEGLLVRDGQDFRLVNLDVIPLKQAPSGVRSYLVLFEDAPPTAVPAAEPAAEAGISATERKVAESRVAQLQQELDATREHLQSVIEEHEATTEELKSAHEEILSSNEELQSTNEELQTAKEEMQSANEELATVNEELRQRNLELGKLNDDLVNLFSGVHIPIVMVGRDLRVRRITPLAEKVINLIPSDLGRSITDIRPNLLIPEFDKLITEVVQTLAIKELEVQDHEGHWYSLRIRPYVTLDNKIDGASIAAVDIDSLKRSLDRLQSSRDSAEAIIDAVSHPLVVLDDKLHLRRANPAFYAITGSTAEESEGKPFLRLDDGCWNFPRLRQLLAAVRDHGTPFRDFDVSGAFPGAGPRTLLVHGQRIIWQGEAAENMVLLVLEDITERRHEVERARQLAAEQSARSEAESANRAKDEFLALLAHELRNPLAPLSHTLHILRDKRVSDADAARALEVAERQVRHIARLLEDLLDVSRITRGKIELRKEPVELGAVVNQVVESVRPALEAAGQQIEVSLPKEPVGLEADRVRLEQVLGNLLNNAVKYTPSGGRIALKAAMDTNEITLRVQDTGIGIAPEMLPRVFDLFTQADRSLDRARGGLGIGLTLVKQLVELHGGRVEAHSEGPGKGSEFIVHLPAAPGAVPPPPPEPEPAAKVARRVLIVEDNADVAESLATLLRLAGHQPRTAADGPAALAEVPGFNPDVVLLDIGLPGMSGYEVAEKLRQLPATKGALLIALTGYGKDEDRKRSREAGFDHHLVKPVDPVELERLLATFPGKEAARA